MGEKGNLVDVSEDVFANLAEQGPQFWLAYEQYKEARTGAAMPRAAREQIGDTDATIPGQRIRPPAAG